MGSRRQLSLETRQSIKVLKNEGYLCRDMAKKFHLQVSTVAFTVKRIEETVSIQERKRSGRPKATSVAQEKYFRVTSLHNRRLSVPQIQV